MSHSVLIEDRENPPQPLLKPASRNILCQQRVEVKEKPEGSERAQIKPPGAVACRVFSACDAVT